MKVKRACGTKAAEAFKSSFTTHKSAEEQDTATGSSKAEIVKVITKHLLLIYYSIFICD